MVNTVDPIEAALDEIDAEDGETRVGGAKRFLPAAGAFIAVAAFGAIVWYAYSTGVREGSEIAAPLLKPSGPSKIAPQDPGGREIRDQDKRVYGMIDRTAGGRQVERLLPPPENLLPLPKKPAPIATPPLATEKLAVPEAPPPPPSITAPAKLPAESETAAAAPVVPAAVTPQAETAPKPVAKPALPPVAVPPAPPLPKPVAQPKPPAKVASVGAVPRPPSPAPVALADGGYRVQIASLRSEDAARQEWDKRVKQSGDVLSALKLFVKRVDIENRGTYYRVQAGPLADRAAAGRICDALKLRKIGCIVVKQ